MNTEALRFTQERETTSSLFVGIDSLEDFIFEEDMVPIRKSSILVAERESLANENPFRSDGNIIQIS